MNKIIWNQPSLDGSSDVISLLPMVTRKLFLTVEPKARVPWLVLGWMLVLLVVYLSLAPTTIELKMEHGDKLSHSLAYIVLMSWFANLYETPMQRVGLVLGFITMGIALEFAQGLVGYRSFEVADMGADAAGVAVGWLLAPPRTPNYLGVAERILRTHS